jgi:hypothetical protein
MQRSKHQEDAMVLLLILAVLVLTAGFVRHRAPVPPAPRPSAAAPVAAKAQPDRLVQLLAFYHDLSRKQALTVKAAVYYTQEAARFLAVADQDDTLLSMANRESSFDPKAHDGHPALGWGIYQTPYAFERHLRREWAALGVDLGPRESIKTQCYLGVMEFRDHLLHQRGDVFKAVMAYNGRGAKAELYAWRVMATRTRAFDRPWKPGEMAASFPAARRNP